MAEVMRCPWPGDDPHEIRYHDEEWGVPARDEATLFEFLTLEGAQAGLSWHTILMRREGYRAAFAGFDAATVAAYTADDVERLLQDPGIIRHRGKIESTISNAKAIVGLREAGESFSELMWSFVGGQPRVNHLEGMGEVAAQTPESKAMSKELQRRGFRFVGPTTCYALMQATGMVNDHLRTCFRWAEVQR